jgi:hypothetical protein
VAAAVPFAVPEFDALLVGLLALMGCLVALGLVSILHRFVRATSGAIGGILGHLPGVGHVLSTPITAVAHWMDREFSAAERALDRACAFFFGELGQLVAYLGSEISSISHALYTLAVHSVGHSAIDAVNGALHRANLAIAAARTLALNSWHVATEARFYIQHATVGPIGAAIHTIADPIARRVTTIAGQVATLERTITARVGRIEHEIAVDIPRSIAAVRELVTGLTGVVNALKARVARIEQILSTAGVAALVATALGTLGLEWLRCSNVGKLGRAACGLPAGLLDDLLAVLVDVLILENVCTVIPLVSDAAEVIGVPIVDALAGVAGAGICYGATPAPRVSVPALHLPPVDRSGLHLAA